MIRLAIIGAHGVGKTTLKNSHLNNLSDSHGTVLSVKDIARLCPFNVGKISNLKAQNWILQNQIAIEKLFYFNDSSVIFDGCSLSHLAYYKYWGGNLKKYIDRIKKSIEIFDKIILLPPNKDFLIDDGLRPTNVKFQTDIHNIILKFLEDFNVKYELLNPKILTKVQNNALSKSLAYKKASHSQNIVTLGLIEKGDKILFIKRNDSKVKKADKKWDLPGGTVIFHEHPAQTVVREVFEETGYLIRADELLPNVINNRWETEKGDIQSVVLCYKCTLVSDVIFTDQLNSEVRQIKWVLKNELSSLNLLRGIKFFINYI